jgi:hypothetical protein
MNSKSIAGYNINLDHAKEVGSLEALKADGRFFHQHEGEERNELCRQLCQELGLPDTPDAKQKKPKQAAGTDQPANA